PPLLPARGRRLRSAARARNARAMKCWRQRFGVWGLGLCALLGACARGSGARPATPISELRLAGENSSNDAALGRWLLGELLSQGGDSKRALEARQRLDQHASEHYWTELALALDDAWHGRLKDAPAHYVRALELASEQESVEARLVAWFAASQAATLSDHVPELWQHSQAGVEKLIEQPRGIGWRARAQLVQWWLDEMSERGQPQVEES